MRLQLTLIGILALAGLRVSGQALPVTATGNILVNGSTGSNSAIASTATTGFKLSAQGSILLWGTGTNTGTSPTLYLRNTTGARIYGLNTDNTGLFSISDATGTTSPLTHVNRFVISSSGNVGIGPFTTAPTAVLQLKAGTATANTAPLKFTSGPPTTTPELGAMHFINGLLILDSSNTVRDTLATRSWARRNIVAGGSSSSPWATTGNNINNTNTGNVGIGVTAPTAALHLKAGTATASTAPLKFNSGPPTTTPELGAMHFNNGLLMLDSSNTIRDTLATRSWARRNIVGGGGVSQVFGRSGNVVAAANDYTFAQIGSKPTTLAGYGITDAALATHTHTLDVLSNVTITTPTNGQVLTYNSTTSKWTNQAAAGGGGGVTSVFNRSGIVQAAAGDYTFAQIGSKPTTLAGYGITDAAPATGATGYIQNTTSQQTTSNFNISGSGTLGGSLTVTGASTFRAAITADFNVANTKTQIRDNGLYITRNTVGDYGNTITGNNHMMDYSTRSGHRFLVNSVGASTFFVGEVGVGIGTEVVPTGYKFAVAGNIICEKVKTRLQSSGWPDFVFKEDYKLLSLKEVELFIKENNHLPGVPSANEIEKNGLDLGDGQAVLLKKIEELTLYMIEINKQVERLKAENQQLKKNN
jgi:trimeric autotransporter adhesin